MSGRRYNIEQRDGTPVAECYTLSDVWRVIGFNPQGTEVFMNSKAAWRRIYVVHVTDCQVRTL